MIKPQDVVISCVIGKPSYCVALERALPSSRCYTWGSCHYGWSQMSSEEIYKSLTWLMLEMVEFYGVPVRMARDCLEDNVFGYKEWMQDCGRFSRGG